MGAAGANVKLRAEPARTAGQDEPAFASKEELREVFERLLEEVEDDPRIGPHRLVFSDLGLVLEVTGSAEGGSSLDWKFAEAPSRDHLLTLEMGSGVANRYLQGKESVAIAVARRRIRVSCMEARMALSFLPANRELIKRYREIIASDYPHLAVD